MPHEHESKIIVEEDTLDDDFVMPITLKDNDTSYNLENLYDTNLDEYDNNYYTIGAIHTIDVDSDYANDMQTDKLGDAMFDEDDMFSPPSFDEQIYYDESMPPIDDDYCDDMYAIKNKYNHETCHHDIMPIKYLMIVISLNLLPLLLMRTNLLMWRVIKFLCL